MSSTQETPPQDKIKQKQSSRRKSVKELSVSQIKSDEIVAQSSLSTAEEVTIEEEPKETIESKDVEEGIVAPSNKQHEALTSLMQSEDLLRREHIDEGLDDLPGRTDEEANAQGFDELQMSVLALKDLVLQRRELNERHKVKRVLARVLEKDRIELEDRIDIIENYDSIIKEQESLIKQCTEERELSKENLADASAKLNKAQELLQELLGEHKQELEPYNHDFEKIRDLANQAKNDERRYRFKLNDAETEYERALEYGEPPLPQSYFDQIQFNYEEARHRSTVYRNQMLEVKDYIRAIKASFEENIAPLRSVINDLNEIINELKSKIALLSEEISSAKKRQAYCESIFSNPEDIKKMNKEIQNAELTLEALKDENIILKEMLDESVERSKNAKYAFLLVVVALVFIVVLISVMLSLH